MDQVQIIFEFNTKYGTFRDALWLPAIHNMTEAEIDAMKQQRLDNWLAVIESPPPEEVAVAAEEEASDA